MTSPDHSGMVRDLRYFADELMRAAAEADDQNDGTKIGISPRQARKFASVMLAAAHVVEEP